MGRTKIGLVWGVSARITGVVVLAAVLGLGAAQAQPVGFPALPGATPAMPEDSETLSRAVTPNPSSVDADFRAAAEAIARGDHDAAIVLLKRILASHPDLPRVKLELGLLYFKIGSYDLARSTLEDAIASGQVPLDIKGRVKLYLAEIERRQAPFQYYVFLQSGARYQTNANVGPDSTVVRAFGQNLLLGNQFAKTPDWNWFQVAILDTAWKLTPRGDAIEATLVGYYAQQDRLRQYDLGLVEAMIGPRVYLNKDVSLKAYAIGDAVWLANAPYFQALGAGGSARAVINDRFWSEAYVEWRHRKFYDSVSFPTSGQQTGDLLTTAIYSELRFGRLRLTTRFGFEANEADFAFNSYRRWSADFGLPIEFSIPVGNGSRRVIVTPTAGFSYTPYNAPNPMVDPFTTRLDRETRVGGILDVQLYQNFGWRTQIMQYWVRSSLPNYDLNNFTIAFGPTARF